MTTIEAVAAASPSPVAMKCSTRPRLTRNTSELHRREHALHHRPGGGVAAPALFLGIERLAFGLPQRLLAMAAAPGHRSERAEVDRTDQPVKDTGGKHCLTTSRPGGPLRPRSDHASNARPRIDNTLISSKPSATVIHSALFLVRGGHIGKARSPPSPVSRIWNVNQLDIRRPAGLNCGDQGMVVLTHRDTASDGRAAKGWAGRGWAPPHAAAPASNAATSPAATGRASVSACSPRPSSRKSCPAWCWRAAPRPRTRSQPPPGTAPVRPRRSASSPRLAIARDPAAAAAFVAARAGPRHHAGNRCISTCWPRPRAGSARCGTRICATSPRSPWASGACTSCCAKPATTCPTRCCAARTTAASCWCRCRASSTPSAWPWSPVLPPRRLDGVERAAGLQQRPGRHRAQRMVRGGRLLAELRQPAGGARHQHPAGPSRLAQSRGRHHGRRPGFLEQPELVVMVGADATAVDGRQAALQAESLLALRATSD